MEQDPTTPATPAGAPQPRRAVSSKLAGALIGAIAALSIGGVGLAFAQEAETPTTEAPSAETPAAPAPTDEDCPDKAGRGGPRGGAEGSGTTPAPAADGTDV